MISRDTDRDYHLERGAAATERGVSVQEGESGCAGSKHRHDGLRTRNRDGVIAAMPVQVTVRALFFDVRNLAARCDITISANDAPAPQGVESEQPHEAHVSPHASGGSNCCTVEVRRSASRIAPDAVHSRANFPHRMTVSARRCAHQRWLIRRSDPRTRSCASGPLDAFAKRLDSVLTRPRGAPIVGDA